MKWLAALALALLGVTAAADTAYVSDELVLGVYAEQNNQGQRLATLHSGTSVERLAQNGDFTQVRLNDGTLGWVKSAFLITQEPAVVRLKHAEEELDRSRATTPALAAAAAQTEVERLTRELKQRQSEVDDVRANAPSASPAAASAHGANPEQLGVKLVWVVSAGVLGAFGAGFWLGYATLSRRVRQKFGGIKVY